MSCKVSFITPLHNKGLYIAETIESALAQTMRDWEMIVVENYSTDDGPPIARGFAQRDARVRFVEAPPEVRGPGVARNCGLAQARGEWILFLDADDLLEPDYLERRLSVLQTYPEARIVAGAWQTFRDGKPKHRERHMPHGWRPPCGPVPDSAYAFCPWVLHAGLVRRDVWRDSEPWLCALDGSHAEDNAFWFRTLHAKTVHWEQSEGALYRQETTNSRDRSSVDVRAALDSTKGTLATNRQYLASLGQRPTPAMAATAVRVLENLLARAKDGGALRGEIRREIARELADTSWLNPAMFIRRIWPATVGRHRTEANSLVTTTR
jgi:glycosyltransferase involved in cell wall biosynthesis